MKVMQFNKRHAYTKNEATRWPIPNYWDLIAMVLVIGCVILLCLSAKKMLAPFNVGDVLHISLSPKMLPDYALRTTLRMFIALFCSLVFTLVFGTWAAKNKHAERLLIPFIDVMQSVPILSFLSITIIGFIALFEGSLLGPECAAIFVIFTSQVWNMTLSFYQSMRTVPLSLEEAANIFQLTPWQRFWRVEVPFAMPGLLWNMMMSMSGSWFFVISSEAITVANQNITLPGIGSYLALAIAQANSRAIIYAILTMLAVIFLYNQLLFRPLEYWTNRFKEDSDEDFRPARSWVVSLFQRTKLLRFTFSWMQPILDFLMQMPWLKFKPAYLSLDSEISTTSSWSYIYYFIISVLSIVVSVAVVKFITSVVTIAELEQVMFLGCITGARVIILIFVCSLIWVPIGVWIGLRPRVTAIIQPIVQFLAAFPANLLFPVMAITIVYFNLNVEVWISPLMVLGTQWYILFNVIAGASALPKELKLAAANFGVKGWLWWWRIIIPGIAPYYITGAITAAGGAWNASIVAEVIYWGSIKLRATGLGAYIQNFSTIGDFPRIALGTIIMCVLVLLINRVLWRPLYNYSVERFKYE